MKMINKMFSHQRKIPDYIIESLEILETHPKDWLSLYARAYQALSYDHPEAIIRLGKIGYHYLSGLTIPQILKVEEQWRSYTSMLWSINWQDIDIQAMSIYFDNDIGYESLLIMGSFHPSGYFREKCLKLLSAYPHTLSFIFMRMNDWVPEVQNAAYRITKSQLSECTIEEFIELSYVFMKVKKSLRRQQDQFDDMEKLYITYLKECLTLLDIHYLCHLDVFIRKTFYQISIEHSLLSIDIVEELLTREKDSFCLLMLTRYLLQSEQLDMSQLQLYLHHPTFYVRKEAIFRYYAIVQNVWDGIEDFLLDKSYAIRDYIRFLLKKHTEFDCLSFYLQHLNYRVGILGVGECGTQQDIPVLIPFLEHHDEKIVKVTIQALSHLMKDNGFQIYWRFLLDERVSLSKAAYQSIIKYKVHYGAKCVYEEYLKVSCEHQKRYLLRILLAEDSWERLPYLLAMYNYPDEKFCHHIQIKVSQRNPYKHVSQTLKADIIDSLTHQDNHIPQAVIDSIMFDLKFVCK
ncbi:hypothetical protein [Candidatus Stoquefichus sp. SB1]|uniref:hypothetical protein n=1 Tax=Candidatus Stoquefichus sp. SB1 TaxID=1658109 RepID=UPI00067F6DEF|nr:hypothetical protein [Candidatus Stoquefichus sp. SB1]